MAHSIVLLNDGSSGVLLNDGGSYVLLNSAEAGVRKHGNFDYVGDFREFRAPAKRFATCIIDISCLIRIRVSPLVEGRIKRSESTPFISRIRRESTIQGISKIYRDSLHEVNSRITHKPRMYEITGYNYKQDQNKHYNELLKEIEDKKDKMDEIKRMYKEYKDE